MRKLTDILDELKDNKNKPEGLEAEYTVLVQDQLIQVLTSKIAELYQIVRVVHPIGDVIMQETVAILKTALQSTPEELLAGNVPGTEPYDTNRKELVAKFAELKQKLLEIQENTEKELAEEEAKVLKDEDKLN